MANNDYKSKASVVRSMMNNPSLKRAIIDALDAPIGSTKRAKAKDVFSAFHKVIAKKMDGQGGPSINSSSLPQFSYTPQKTSFSTDNANNYNNIRILPNIPDPQSATDFSKWSNIASSIPSISSNASMFGDGGLDINKTPSSNNTIKPGAGLPENTLSKLFIPNVGQTPVLKSNTSLPANLSASLKKVQQDQALANLRKSAGINQVGAADPNAFASTFGKDKLQSLMNTLNSFKTESPINHTSIQNKLTVNQPQNNIPGAPQGPTTNETAGVDSTQPSAETAPTSGQYSGDAAIQSQWDALSPEDQKRYKPVFDAAYSKLGAGTFFYGAMSDKTLLKQLFPGLSDEDLPHGASLAGQMNDVQKTLKDQYGLDALLNQKTKLASESKNFSQDMTDYISGRDQFLGDVNRMIQDAENKSVDITTPYAANTMKNYLNYLYVLKGRQNKNYVDYLNSAINYQNNQIQTVDSEYTNMVNAYNDDFKNKSTVATDDYNRWYTILTDMYNKLDTSLSTQLDLQKKQADVDQVYANMSIDAIKAQNANTKTTSWLTEMPQYQDYIIDANTKTKGQLLPGVDLASVVARATDNNLNPQGVFDTFQIGARNSISASGGDPNTLNSTMNNIADTLRNYNSNTKGQNASVVTNMIQGLGQQTQYQVADYISNNAKSIAQAIQDLGNNKNKTASDFAKNHPLLDSVIAKQLFNYYKSNPEYSNNPQRLFSTTGKISDLDIPALKDIIAKSISNAWTKDLTTSVNQY